MHELIELADNLERLATEFEAAPFHSDLQKLREAANAVGRAWSGSNLGYHACVYYADFEPPPPGAHFSAEWGMDDAVGMGSRGDWEEFDFAAVKQMVIDHGGNPDLSKPRKNAQIIKDALESAKHELISHLTIASDKTADPYLKSLMTKVEKFHVLCASNLFQISLPKEMISRDALAVSQGWRVAPHQEILLAISEIEFPAPAAKALAQIARQAGSHLARLNKRTRRDTLIGTNVFIGHGRAFAWRDLKDFVGERLGLPYDEFNRVPVAGITNTARLLEMLDAAAVAFIILTAEDEQADGKMHARLNVIHEVGLFQGRLGFTKAIVLLEEGCEQFSNIEGLGQIRFPAGRISAVFEEIPRVLEREGLIE